VGLGPRGRGFVSRGSPGRPGLSIETSWRARRPQVRKTTAKWVPPAVRYFSQAMASQSKHGERVIFAFTGFECMIGGKSARQVAWIRNSARRSQGRLSVTGDERKYTGERESTSRTGDVDAMPFRRRVTRGQQPLWLIMQSTSPSLTRCFSSGLPTPRVRATHLLGRTALSIDHSESPLSYRVVPRAILAFQDDVPELRAMWRQASRPRA